MAPRPFRFALSLGDFHDRASLVATIRRAEEAGFHVLTGVDHIGPPLGVLPLLAMVAQLSELRVSPMVIANDYRHPVLLAKDAATIDALSEGRFELGLGTGWIRSQYESAGIPYERAGVRVGRLEEAIAVIKGCWTAERFVFAGDHYRVDLVGSPRPFQPGGPPLLIGAAGDRMLALAGRHADIVGFTLTLGQTGFDSFSAVVATSAARIDHQLGVVQRAAGERFGELELSAAIHYIEPDVDAANAFAQRIDVDPELLLASPHGLVGPQDQMADTLRRHRQQHGLSYFAFRGADLDHAAPVVSQLSGS